MEGIEIIKDKLTPASHWDIPTGSILNGDETMVPFLLALLLK